MTVVPDTVATMDLSTAVFHESLAELLRAGMPIAQAVGAAGSAAGGSHGGHASAWAAHCQAGGTLASAMQAGGGRGMEAALVEAGERSGRLPELCRLWAGYVRQTLAARRMVLMRLLYPVFLVHLALVVLAVPYVVPRVMAGEAVSLAWLFAGPLVLWAVILGVWLRLRRASPAERARWLMLPGLRGTTEAWIATNTCTVLHAGAAAGMLVPQMLELAAEASGHHLTALRLRDESRRAVAEGTTLPVALGRAGLPTDLVARLTVAEKAGAMDTALEQLAVQWHERFDQRLDRLVRTAIAAAYGTAMVVGAATVILFWANYFAGMLAMAEAAGA